jgi:hypothetical protein
LALQLLTQHTNNKELLLLLFIPKFPVFWKQCLTEEEEADLLKLFKQIINGSCKYMTVMTEII